MNERDEEDRIEPVSEYDDPDEPDDDDRIFFDAGAYAAMQRLHARWGEAPAGSPPQTGSAFAQAGQYNFKMRLWDLADAVTALKLKKKPVPVRFELQPARLRLSVEAETGLVCQVDAPLISGPMAGGVCFERAQDLMIHLMRIRTLHPADTEINCELDLDKRRWQIELPMTSAEALPRGRKRGRKPQRPRPTLRVGIVVPETPAVRPWERDDLGAGRAVDAAGLARAVSCAGRLMSHHVVPRQPGGIDVAQGRALAGRKGAFYHVVHPSLEGLEFRLTPPDRARFLRVLARMNPDTARCHATEDAQIFTDGVLVCAVPRAREPFPAVERIMEELDYDEIVLRQDRERPFFKGMEVFLPDPDGLITAELVGLPDAFSLRFSSRIDRGKRRGDLEFTPGQGTMMALASPGAASDPDPRGAGDVVPVDAPGPLETINQEITVASEALCRVMAALPTGPVRLRFVASRLLMVVHELDSMRATACFANRGSLAPKLRG